MSLPTITSTYDWRDLTNVTGFFTALSLRMQALGLTGETMPVAGDIAPGATKIAGWQNFLAVNCATFVDPTFTWSGFGLTYDATTGDINNYPRNAKTFGPGGTAPAVGPDTPASYTNFLKAAGCGIDENGNYNWKRRRLARIASSASTAYDDLLLNTAANDPPTLGAVALSTANGSKYTWTNVLGVNQWVLTVDQTTTCTELEGWGNCTAGDLWGSYLWTELKAAIVLLTVQYFDQPGTAFATGGGKFGSWYDAPANMPSTKTTALGLYNGSSGAMGNEPHSLSYLELYTSGGSRSIVGLEKSKGRGTTPTRVAGAQAAPRTHAWYCWSRAIGYAMAVVEPDPGGALVPWISADGSPPTRDQFYNWVTDTPGTGVALGNSSTFIPTSLTTAPAYATNFYHTDSHGDFYEEGYELGGPFLIVTWDFGD